MKELAGKAPWVMELPMLDAILSGAKLWDIKDENKDRRKKIKEIRGKISKEHEYMCEHEPEDQFHANTLLGALNLIDGLLDRDRDVLAT